MKIKICHIITMLELGGAQGNTLYTVSNLDKSMFDAALIAGPGGILDDDAKKTENIDLYFVPQLVRQVNPIKDIVALFKLRKLLKSIKSDLVHTHSSKAGILGRIAAYLAGVPVIIHTFHGFGFNDFQKWFVKFVYVLAERITAKISDKLIVVSNENISYGLANRIGRKEQYMVIRSGIKTGKYRQKFDAVKIKKELGLKETDKIITTIGPFKPQKNTVDFIDMAAQVSGKFPDVKFLVIGDGSLRPQIESKIAAFNLQNKVMLLGWRNDIPELLSITDIFILTSLWEGLPRAIVESMVSGKPVIAYAVDGSKEIVKDNVTGFLIPPKNMEVLCEKTMLLLSDDNLRLKFGMEAQKTVSTEFDIDHMVKQQESLYKELVKK